VAYQGDITVFASAAGVGIPATEIEIGFQESGTLSELLVKVGERVEAGQVLARLETENTEESIALDISNAELSVLNAQNALDDLNESWELDTAAAQQAVADAQQALEDAEVAYHRTLLTASQATIDTEYADMIIAREALEKAQENFEAVAHKPSDNLERANLRSALSNAQQAYDTAVANYNAAISAADETEQAVAEAGLAYAQAELAEAQREWERLQDGPDPDEIALAEAELANAQAQLELALEEQVIIDLAAPIDGTVLSIEANVGENVGTGSFITLADMDQPLLEIYLDETDLDKVAVGYEVEVVFDAYPDETFTGRVVEVDPSLQTVANVSTVVAQVQLDIDTLTEPQTLPIGINASVDVISGKAVDAVLVPVEALREIGPDEYVVFVMENDEPRLRVVTVGLVDYTSAEIITGLEAGEVVTTGLVETE
jgi:HlyD family secretion protein